jgi:hypothetical protein
VRLFETLKCLHFRRFLSIPRLSETA